MRWGWLAVLAFLLGSCNPPAAPPPRLLPASAGSATPAPIPDPTIRFTFTTLPRIPTPQPAEGGWQLTDAGLEVRHIRQPLSGDMAGFTEEIWLLRFDPQLVTASLDYDPQGRSVSEWLAAQPDSLAVINAGFFREDGNAWIPTGLTILQGQPMGETYTDFAGMVLINHGRITLRWLGRDPWNVAETADYAFQSFPMLVRPGGELGFPAQAEDNQIARRSAIARDREGRVLLISADRGYFTLHQFSSWLVGSDLDLDMAINLDGGPSSGLLARGAGGSSRWGVDSLSRVPLALLVSSASP